MKQHRKNFSQHDISINQESEGDIVNDCAVPNYNGPSRSELPTCTNPKLYCLIEKYCKLFYTKPGYTEDAWHYILTIGNPVNVPPRHIPAHLHTEFYKQIQTILNEGIIRRSKSPWMAPAVFVSKKSGQLRICIDHRELKKHTTKDSYPLLLPDEYKTSLLGQQYSQCLIFIADTGSCMSILQTETRLLSFQVLVWGFTSSAECHLGYPVPLVHFST